GERRARAVGWHRSFCFRVPRFRGTPERPGLMLALDRGGACVGMAQRLAGPTVRERLDLVLRREMSIRETPNQPRWIIVRDEDGAQHPAVAFAADRTSSLYCGRQPMPTTVDALADAIGHVGSCAEYLMRTVQRLDELGIHDAYLWRLQELVAHRIRATTEES
ncbi:MAG: gamma-glutamylcyclotransferase, partial [Alphaproteobacteria bacterium]